MMGGKKRWRSILYETERVDQDDGWVHFPARVSKYKRLFSPIIGGKKHRNKGLQINLQRERIFYFILLKVNGPNPTKERKKKYIYIAYNVRVWVAGWGSIRRVQRGHGKWKYLKARRMRWHRSHPTTIALYLCNSTWFLDQFGTPYLNFSLL